MRLAQQRHTNISVLKRVAASLRAREILALRYLIFLVRSGDISCHLRSSRACAYARIRARSSSKVFIRGLFIQSLIQRMISNANSVVDFRSEQSILQFLSSAMSSLWMRVRFRSVSLGVKPLSYSPRSISSTSPTYT